MNCSVETKEETKEEMKKRIMEENSMNYGMSACVVLGLTIIKDALKWWGDIEGYHLNGIVGTIAILSCFAILKFNLSGRVEKKKEYRNFIDICTFISILVFTFENAIFDFVDKANKLPVSIAFGAIIAVPFFMLVYMFVKRNK